MAQDISPIIMWRLKIQYGRESLLLCHFLCVVIFLDPRQNSQPRGGSNYRRTAQSVTVIGVVVLDLRQELRSRGESPRHPFGLSNRSRWPSVKIRFGGTLPIINHRVMVLRVIVLHKLARVMLLEVIPIFSSMMASVPRESRLGSDVLEKSLRVISFRHPWNARIAWRPLMQ
jgi:hypothetical protein